MFRKLGAFRVLLSLGLLGGGIAIGVVIGLTVKTEPKSVPLQEFPDVLNLDLSDQIRLTLFAIPGVAGMYATDTPITNCQYLVAVGEGKVPVPVLSEEWGADVWEKVLWKGGRYPEGQAACAVLFINEAEAERYCRWLERRFPQYEIEMPGLTRHHSEAAERDCRLALEVIEPELSWKFSESIKTGTDPRPSRDGGRACLSKNGLFWHAPRTNELYRPLSMDTVDYLYEHGNAKARNDLSSVLSDKIRELHGVQGRYSRFAMSGGGVQESMFGCLPNTFRVVATIRGSQKWK